MYAPGDVIHLPENRLIESHVDDAAERYMIGGPCLGIIVGVIEVHNSWMIVVLWCGTVIGSHRVRGLPSPIRGLNDDQGSI